MHVFSTHMEQRGKKIRSNHGENSNKKKTTLRNHHTPISQTCPQEHV